MSIGFACLPVLAYEQALTPENCCGVAAPYVTPLSAEACAAVISEHTLPPPRFAAAEDATDGVLAEEAPDGLLAEGATDGLLADGATEGVLADDEVEASLVLVWPAAAALDPLEHPLTDTDSATNPPTTKTVALRTFPPAASPRCAGLLRGNRPAVTSG
jgi:hypothetical protein